MSDKFTLKNETEYNETFRSEKVRSQFDIEPKDTLTHTVTLNTNLPEKWTLGAIVGPSGSGKTTLSHELFSDADLFDGTEPVIQWSKTESIIDGFPKSVSVSEITEILTRVGFSSPPNWLQPYHTLSTGQQFRVDMARLLVDADVSTTVVDEFTSTVDRQVAKSISHAVAKCVRSRERQFVAVSCHYDILDWLEPDWVIDLETEEVVTDPPFQKPEITVEITPVEHRAWQIFREHHYLDDSLNKAAHSYVAYWNDKPVTFIAVLHFPHRKTDKFKRVTRLVTLPPYQGLGIGTSVLDTVAHHYRDLGNRFTIVTSHPGLMQALNQRKTWRCIDSFSRNASHAGDEKKKSMNKTSSEMRKTATFEYHGDSTN